MNKVDNVDFSIVVPVYNSEKTIEELVRRIDILFKKLSRSYELILVNDGSQDRVWEKIEELHHTGYPIKAFNFMKNQGQHYALKCGLDNSHGKYVITLDDDLQHPPEEISKLIEAIESHPDYDVVIGKYEYKKHSFFRNAGTLLNKLITQAMFPHSKVLVMTSFRIINQATIQQIKAMRHANPRLGLMILTVSNRIMNVEVTHSPRQCGKSGYNLRKMIKNTFDNMINYSSLPLKFISFLGLCFFLASSILILYYVIMYCSDNIKVSGFMTLIIVLLLTGGLTMFSFGLVGEYLSRIVSQQLLDREYYIRDTLTAEEQAAETKDNS